MSIVRLIADLHLDHSSILKFSPSRYGSNIKEHNQWLIDQWNSVVRKRDITIILGDVSFSREGLEYLNKMNGVKHLILGNHDRFPISLYQEYFTKIHGFKKYKGYWLSHAPIHPLELRGRRNIHGHTHEKTIPSSSYISVSVEQCNGIPVKFEDIVEKKYEKNSFDRSP